MKRKIPWLLAACVTVAAFLLASCGPAAPSTQEPTTPTTPTTPTAPTTPTTPATPTPSADVPKYGGTFTQVTAIEPLYFDEPSGHPVYSQTLFFTHDELYQSDYGKGLAGTKEAAWQLSIMATATTRAPRLAESYEIIDANTVLFKIRRGVRFHIKPPANGREMNAEDVVFSLQRIWANPRSIQSAGYPKDLYVESITNPDKWTVIVKSKPGMMGSIFPLVSDLCQIVPREVGTLDTTGWGFQYLSDWKNEVGTGPFILTDYVPGSALTFERNSNYWMKDPIHPENALPYVDQAKLLVITDTSTRIAALRTGKIDWLGGRVGTGAVGWEEAGELIKTRPELKYSKYLPDTTAAIHWRIDKPDLPYYDVRVRRALVMAVNKKEIAQTFYGGQAEMMVWPVHPIPQYNSMYIPIEQCSQTVKDLFDYKPDQAKQLLAEAGYPNGFKASVVTTTGGVDLLSIIAAYWSKIGVQLEIQVKEPAAYETMRAKKTHEGMFFTALSGTLPYRFFYETPHTNNMSMVNDPKINQAKVDCSAAWLDEPKRDKIVRDIVPYLLENAFHLQLPAPYVYTFWWPWVKNYAGDFQVGYCNYDDFARFIWIDQDMKTKMRK